uniref:ribosomal protein S4 n=1 Tax=Cocconeiopsis kantsiensis TaxID=3082010 RepID=UPI003001B392
MFNKHKKRFGPFYKQVLAVRDNVNNNKKILKFKKEKWAKIIKYTVKQNKPYRKFKAISINNYIISKNPNKYFSYKNRYKHIQQNVKKLNLLYGGLNSSPLKRILRKNKKNISSKLLFLKFYEQRLDTILYRSKFFTSIKKARQFIKSGNVKINKRKVKLKSYLLKTGDLISINFKNSTIIKEEIKLNNVWPIPPKYLIINYKTMEIIFLGIKNESFLRSLFFYCNLEHILTDYKNVK